MRARSLATIAALCACTAALVGAAPVSAAPIWNLDIHHNETNFPPGGTAEYWFDVNNVGDTATSGTITLTVKLPAGITRRSVRLVEFNPVHWNCPGSPGQTTVTCTTTDSIERHSLSRSLILSVDVSPALEGDRFATAKVEGGGAAKAANAVEPTHASPTPATFGIVPESFVPDFFKADGLTPERKSGAHPELLTVPFDFNTISLPRPSQPNQKAEAGTVRDLEVLLPPGFVGYPTAVGECTPAELSFSTCPRSSQIGRADLSTYPISSEEVNTISTGVFNMTHPRGSVTDLAFVFAGIPVHIKASLDPANHYAIRTTVSDINETLPPFHQKLTVWGVPADSSHDSERCHQAESLDTSATCETDQPRKAFLTVPSSCDVAPRMTLRHYDSWQETGVFGPELSYEMPEPITDCDKPRFEPEIEVVPTGKQANTPTGLDVHLRVPQNPNANGQATPPVKSTVVTLPEGMTLSPSFADGLEGCSPGQIGLGSNDAIACPDSSRIGEVQLSTPLLPKALTGSMYLAKQGDNPFGSLIAFYLAVHDNEERGVLVKLAGKVELDPATGRITTSFDDLPQFPFEDFTLKFRSGDRAPLANPPTCGTHTIGVTMTSYAQPDVPVDVSNTYQVSEGPGGAPCPGALSARPFDPQLAAGTRNPVAGAFSPFDLRVFRTDPEQEIASLQATLPPGLVASLRGVGRCSETQIAAVAARTATGQGALEIASPSCPATSQIGTVEAGAGAGSSPIYVPGKVYLAGPYKGAPLSGVAIVPAVTGPVDLGVIVVRSPAYVDPATARIRIATDPFPQIVNGVRVRVRDVRVHLDRPGFTLNPTDCEAMRLTAQMQSTEGASSSAANRFQVGECSSLGFEPSLAIKLSGGTARGGHPALTGTFRPRKGDANLAGMVVRLPRSAFLDQGHIRTVCTRVQYAAHACPEASVYGHVLAYTPLLGEPLEGPVYLRSSSHLLPDLVVALHGTIDVEASARIDSVKGGIRATFTDVPDAPLEKVVLKMQGQKKGLIQNSTDLCRNAHRAGAELMAHNGRAAKLKVTVVPECGKARKKQKHR